MQHAASVGLRTVGEIALTGSTASKGIVKHASIEPPTAPATKVVSGLFCFAASEAVSGLFCFRDIEQAKRTAVDSSKSTKCQQM